MHAQTEFDLSAGFAKSDALLAKRATANALKRDTKAVNVALYGMGRTYHDGVPVQAVSDLLVHYGFDALEDMLLCGREGSLHENVGRNRWLSLTWYKMESGRYEVVAYVS
jgi:hypothetical protein